MSPPKTEPAIERVAASCPGSKYKDDRHEWTHLMHQDFLICRQWRYALRQCNQCRLTVLLLEAPDSSGYSHTPERGDIIIHAFYAEKP